MEYNKGKHKIRQIWSNISTYCASSSMNILPLVFYLSDLWIQWIILMGGGNKWGGGYPPKELSSDRWQERTNNGCYNKTMMSGVPLQMLFCLLFSPATGKKTNICIYVVKMRRQQNGGKYKNKESVEVCIIA